MRAPAPRSAGKRAPAVRNRSAVILAVAGVAALLTAPPSAEALEPGRAITQYASRIWTTDHGLPLNTVTAACQTRDGYVWLGTKAGLTRFDGLRFETFATENTPALPDNWITSLLEDREGRLWIGGWLGLTTYHQGHFERFRDIVQPQNPVFSLLQSRTGALWFGTGRGLARWEDGKLTVFDSRQGLGNAYVRTIAEDQGGHIWVGTDGGGVSRLDGVRFTTFTTRDGLPSDVVWRLMFDRRGGLWAGTYKGLARHDGDRWASYAHVPGLPTRDVRALYEDPQGSLWVGATGGVTRVHPREDGTLTVDRGLSEQVVLAIWADREDGLWVGTDNGAWRLSARPFAVWGRPEGLPRDVVWAVLVDRRGVVWIGTDAAGLFALEGGLLRAYTKAQGLPGDAINALFSDRRGRLWVGTDLGLAVIDDGRVRAVDESRGVPARNIRSIGEDPTGRLLLGLEGGVLRQEGDSFRDVSRELRMETADAVLGFTVTKDGALWIATGGSGLRRIKEGTLTVVDDKSGLPNTYVYNVHEGPDGALWLPTGGGGLCRFKDGRFQTIGEKQGLPNDVLSILEDPQGRFWLGSHRGVLVVPRSALEAVADGRAASVTPLVYTTADGLRSPECVDGVPGASRAPDGALWFATVKGAARIDPRVEFPELRPPAVAIEALLVNQAPVALDVPARLGPGVRNLEIRYTAPSFIAPERMRFRYRLDGYDQGWIPAEQRRAAYYTNVKPGAYRFVVSARLGSGDWSSETAQEFEVRPYLRETRWAYALGAVLVALAGAALQRARQRVGLRRLQEREDQLTRLVETRTNELQEANEALEERARELTALNEQLEQISLVDGLTGVRNRRSFDASWDEEWRRALRLETPLSLLMMDLDHFKRYNDQYGHPAGDECLRQVAGVIGAALQRASDLVARYGGEEFVVILPTTPAAGAVDLAERIRAAVEALRLPHAGSSHGVVTISTGVATVVPHATTSTQQAIAAADAALYQAKREGRNRVCVG